MRDVELLMEEFRRRFEGVEPTVHVRAPGRVNLIGEHVDYHDGLVLPVAIDLAIHAVAGKATDDEVHVFSSTLKQSATLSLRDSSPPVYGAWVNHIKGVMVKLVEAGVPLRGARICIGGDLPMGCGLASSASIQVATALALLAVSGRQMSPEEIAALCREAEHEFVGVPCGAMDAMTCACARSGHAMLLDCRDHTIEHIPLPTEIEIVIIDSGTKHELAKSAYVQRVQEGKELLARLNAVAGQRFKSLREVRPKKLLQHSKSLDGVLVQRGMHVVEEIGRVKRSVEALRNGDEKDRGGPIELGRLMYESHASLRDIYQVSTVELDALVEILAKIPSVYGAKLTGAGFGGCVVAVTAPGALASIEKALRLEYDRRFSVRARLWVTRAAAGAEASLMKN